MSTSDCVLNVQFLVKPVTKFHMPCIFLLVFVECLLLQLTLGALFHKILCMFTIYGEIKLFAPTKVISFIFDMLFTSPPEGVERYCFDPVQSYHKGTVISLGYSVR